MSYSVYKDLQGDGANSDSKVGQLNGVDDKTDRPQSIYLTYKKT